MTEKNPGFIEKHKKGIAATIALGATAVMFGPKAISELDEAIYPKSEIVRGVPAQVESHSYKHVCRAYGKNAICLAWGYNYYLGLEQNHKDIEAAKEGIQTQSFDPKVGEVYNDSNYDTVRVAPEIWQAYPDGSVISFDGPVSEPLER
ncbi:MAG TPA: hypothetical protein VK497_00980 [Candidatus Saccharimonadales bacterium]|nr:hypothetical protein [Candidatus Saccharimonadales bacterium]